MMPGFYLDSSTVIQQLKLGRVWDSNLTTWEKLTVQ